MEEKSKQPRTAETAQTPKKILIVDDDAAIRKLIYRFLGQKNYQVEAAEDGRTALKRFEEFSPDLVILDVILPDIIGYEVCQEMKQRWGGTLVMLLTSLTDVEHHVTGLEWADAYLTKPFHLRVLEKQVQALLRLLPSPSTAAEREPLHFGKLMIDPMRREVSFDNRLISLTALEFDLLHFFARHPGRVCTRQQLIREVWDHEFVGDGRVVDVHIGQIRRKIEPDSTQPIYIRTSRGVGYLFDPPEPSKQ
jgi:two-component system OmpR family response regulator